MRFFESLEEIKIVTHSSYLQDSNGSVLFVNIGFRDEARILIFEPALSGDVLLPRCEGYVLKNEYTLSKQSAKFLNESLNGD